MSDNDAASTTEVTDDDEALRKAREARLPTIRAFTQFKNSMRAVYDLIEHQDVHRLALDSNAEHFKKRVQQWNPVDSEEVIDAIYQAAEAARHNNADPELLFVEVSDAAVEAVFKRSKNPRMFAAQYHSDLAEAMSRRPRTNLMREALLTSAVAAFEALMTEIMFAAAQKKPKSMFQSERKYRLHDIAEFDSIEDLMRDHAETFIKKKVYESVTDWFDWLGRCVDLPISRITANESDFLEIFLRRNNIVHAGALVNQIYLDRLPKDRNAPKLNERLSVGAKYLAKSCDYLLAAGFSAYAHFISFYEAHSDPGAEVRGLIGTNSYRLLLEGRYQAVSDYCESVKHLCEGDDSSLQVLQVNHWLARRELGFKDEVRAEVEQWDVSGKAQRFELARLALMGDLAPAFMLADKMISAGELPLVDWFQWPLLAEVRGYADELPGGYTPRIPEPTT